MQLTSSLSQPSGDKEFIRDNDTYMVLISYTQHSKAHGAVYDITEFVRLHPGGYELVSGVGGQAIDGYWAMYAFHQKGNARAVLEQYRIGTLVKKSLKSP